MSALAIEAGMADMNTANSARRSANPSGEWFTSFPLMLGDWQLLLRRQSACLRSTTQLETQTKKSARVRFLEDSRQVKKSRKNRVGSQIQIGDLRHVEWT
jgi:hypothetical protein